MRQGRARWVIEGEGVGVSHAEPLLGWCSGCEPSSAQSVSGQRPSSSSTPTTALAPDGAVIGVLGAPITLDECPAPLRPFMHELAAIGRDAHVMEDEDDAEGGG